MIKKFKCKETKKIFDLEISTKLLLHIQKVALRKLEMLDAAVKLCDLKVPPANFLEALHKDREGQHSIRINIQWRICFKWEDGHAYDVEIVDYH